MAKRKKPAADNRFRTSADAAGETLNDAPVVTPPEVSAPRTPAKSKGRASAAGAASASDASSTPPPAQRATAESESVTSSPEPVASSPELVSSVSQPTTQAADTSTRESEPGSTAAETSLESAPGSTEPAPPSLDRVEHSEPADPRELVAARAYELYEGRGGSHGGDLEDWLEAERQIHGRSGDRPNDE